MMRYIVLIEHFTLRVQCSIQFKTFSLLYIFVCIPVIAGSDTELIILVLVANTAREGGMA